MPVRSSIVRKMMIAFAVGGVALATGTASAEYWSKNVYLRSASGASLTSSANQSFGNRDFDNAYIIGGGVGYRFSPNIRTDVTLGYRGDYQFRQRSNLGAAGTGTASADLDSLVGLLNA